MASANARSPPPAPPPSAPGPPSAWHGQRPVYPAGMPLRTVAFFSHPSTQYIITSHAFQRMRERGISARDVRNVLLNGTPVSKDLPHINPRRAPGINVEGDLEDGRRIRVKVSWQEKYAVVTAHEVEP